MKPLNIGPMIPVLLSCMSNFDKAMKDRQVTVSEAIDILSTMAHEIARQKGVADSPVVVME